ncbi:MAG: hypothetical protein JWP81_4726 [Ferruginibacter sp.]|nr:hypothetical protein [Ferruginibacter sp.]
MNAHTYLLMPKGGKFTVVIEYGNGFTLLKSITEKQWHILHDKCSLRIHE